MLARARLAAGVYGCISAPAFVRWRSVHPDVLLSDLGVLGAKDMGRLAHSCHRVRVHSADAEARDAGPTPSASSGPGQTLAAGAPNFLGAAILSGRGPWCTFAGVHVMTVNLFQTGR